MEQETIDKIVRFYDLTNANLFNNDENLISSEFDKDILNKKKREKKEKNKSKRKRKP